MKRKYIKDNEGNYIEVDIYGEASENGKDIVIIGECKTKISKNNVDNFIRKKLKRLDRVYPDIFPLVVTHMISSQGVDEYIEEKGLKMYYTYDF